MGEQLRFAVLGPVRGWRGPDEVDLGPPKQRAVLAILLLGEGAQVSVQTLVDAIWGTESPGSALSSLRTYVYRLRQLLGAPAILSVGDGYQMSTCPDSLDLTAFRHLVGRAEQARCDNDGKTAARYLNDALAHWQGTALTGIRGEYAQAQRDRLERLRLSAMEASFAVRLDLGEHTDIARELASLVAEHPMDERFREMLMLALYRSGRQAEALMTYGEARSLLADELGIDPGPELRAMYERILRADVALTTPPAPTPPHQPKQAPRHATPAQLPADLPAFVGRAAELAQVDMMLDGDDGLPAHVGVAVISGMAGVGKSTFAVHWAHRVASRFPDGQLYINLRGFDPAGLPVSPDRALRTVLESFGTEPISLPQDADALAACYRTQLAGRQVLLLLDNARDAQQVRPLLPANPGCMVIVTSRNRLSSLIATDGARPVHLDVLTVTEGRDFLARRLSANRAAAEPAALDEIIEHCARLPLALSIAAARALARSAFPLATLAGELGDGQSRLNTLSDRDAAADVRAVFSWSYHALTPASARLFRLIALHPGPDTSLAAAASLAGLTVPHTHQLLTELTEAHLVDESVPGRYAIHDLLRAYADELTHATDAPDEQHAARLRALDHYLHSAHHAGRAYSPDRHAIALPAPSQGVQAEEFPAGPERAGSAAAWFDTEQAVLMAAIRTAAVHGCDTHTWQLAWAIGHHLDRKAHWHDLEATQHMAMEAAKRLEDPCAQAHVHQNLARAAAPLGRVEEARNHMERAVELFTAADEISACADSHRALSWVAEQQGDLEAALSHAQQSLARHRATDEEGPRTAAALNAVGWCHALLGQHQQALDHCQEALAIAVVHHRPYLAADIWDSIGLAQHHLGRHPEAVAGYEQALALYRTVGVPYAEADTLRRLGDTHLSSGRLEQARAAWTQALAVLERLDHADKEAVRAQLKALTTNPPCR
ncbi:tetratricopeptide repeat protein [Streptomyces luteolifulvus]|uniref:Tetratricopeptide repeat protein n=1 Tax=Streptomyces luteolifulvus TaxID=2615112 RepID=A0A6H9UR91_9ACTN|nr:BTAD domain-containing putative transcriptional regulator [Streptomyces luteolifulvus]KAB1140838.1 tetratricopeptide repeat protein [Streptomyces luteolifulvus]